MKTYIMGRTGLIGSALAQHCDLTDDPREADYLIFAAGYGQPAKFMADPVGTLRVNTAGLLGMIDAMRPGARLLYLSSSEIYSGNSGLKFSEDQIGRISLHHERACYIEAKRCGEVICNAARTQSKDVVIARVSMVYGPGFKRGDARVLNQFVQMACDQGHIKTRNTGQVWRSFLYLDDCVEILLNILTAGKQDVYNVGGVGGATQIRDLAYKVASLSGATCEISTNDDCWEGGATGCVELRMNRYLREFGQKQFVSLDEGLRRTIRWYRAQKVLEAAA